MRSHFVERARGIGRVRHTKKPAKAGFFVCGAPGTIRTCDPLVRSQVLYPAELRVRNRYFGLVGPNRGPVL